MAGGHGSTHLQDTREHFHKSCVLVAVHLDDVDKADLDLGAVTEWLESRSKFLSGECQPLTEDFFEAVPVRTPISLNAKASTWSGRALAQSTLAMSAGQTAPTRASAGSARAPGCAVCQDLIAATICTVDPR